MKQVIVEYKPISSTATHLLDLNILQQVYKVNRHKWWDR